MLPALQEVRHLARLLHSDETVVHTVMAIALLRFERRAFEAATERGLLASTDWTVPTEDDLNAMHRVVVTKAYMLAGEQTLRNGAHCSTGTRHLRTVRGHPRRRLDRDDLPDHHAMARGGLSDTRHAVDRANARRERLQSSTGPKHPGPVPKCQHEHDSGGRPLPNRPSQLHPATAQQRIQ